MIGDRVNTKPKHSQAANEVFALIQDELQGGRLTFTVAGQSGAGKSEVAEELASQLESHGLKTIILQQDDYFFYPPKTNHNRRVEDIEWVGVNEVNLQLLDQQLATFKNAKPQLMEKPLVVFEEDRIISEKLDLSPFQAMIVEGTYTTLLKNVNFHVFIDRDYHDTKDDRKERGREAIDNFSEQVMKIEDAIISKHRTLADIVISKEFHARLANDSNGG
jgi:uridine kinase